jgi:hypothetical protein
MSSDEDKVTVGWVVLSDCIIDKETGQRGIDLNWDGELHPTQAQAVDSACIAVETIDWVVVSEVQVLRTDLPEWWPTDECEPDGRPSAESVAAKQAQDAFWAEHPEAQR